MKALSSLKVTRFFLVAFFYFILSTVSFSQEQNVDIIYLKNGSSLKGKITEVKENNYVKIMSLENVEFTFQWYAIERIGDEVINNISDTSDENDNLTVVSYPKSKNGTNITYGLSLGLSFESANDPDLDLKSVVSVPLSGIITFGFNKMFLETGVRLKKQGFKYSDTGGEFKWKQGGIIVPINLGILIKQNSVTIKPFLGPYNAFHLGSKYEGPPGVNVSGNFYELGLNLGLGLSTNVGDNELELRMFITRSFFELGLYLDSASFYSFYPNYKSFEFAFIYHFVNQ
jgi:hypothetical protein